MSSFFASSARQSSAMAFQGDDKRECHALNCDFALTPCALACSCGSIHANSVAFVCVYRKASGFNGQVYAFIRRDMEILERGASTIKAYREGTFLEKQQEMRKSMATHIQFWQGKLNFAQQGTLLLNSPLVAWPAWQRKAIDGMMCACPCVFVLL